jgi:hypothetical protein
MIEHARTQIDEGQTADEATQAERQQAASAAVTYVLLMN